MLSIYISNPAEANLVEVRAEGSKRTNDVLRFVHKIGSLAFGAFGAASGAPRGSVSGQFEGARAGGRT
jgi:hypothetical protein